MAFPVRGLLILWMILAVTGRHTGHRDRDSGSNERPQPTGTTKTIGKNPRTCITFDKPQSHRWYHSAKGVRTRAPGVDTQKTCGLVGNCGLSRKPLKLGIPLFERNRIVDVSVSIWFKRDGGRGCWPVLSSKGNPRSGTIQVDSLDDTHLMVTVGHCSGMKYQDTFLTDSQSSDWRHLVITVHVGRSGDREWVKVYLDGNKCRQCLQPPVFHARTWHWGHFQNFFRNGKCGPCGVRFYRGFVDSLSIARYALTPREVRMLYGSRGMCIGLEDNFKNNDCDNNWALIVAGSSGYGNYRHQADACHAYRILIAHGFPPARIVLMMYDDIAQHNRNPDKGRLFNKVNGPNVYDVMIDYRGNDVTAENFLKVLRGDAAGMQGIGSQKVIDSGSNDNIFVYYTNHGGPAILGFPTGSPLTAVSLNSAILQMHNNNRYRRMVFYIDACNSGSMFRTFLPSNLNVYATTSTNPTQESRAVHYSQHHASYLGDEYSVHWMEDSDVKDIFLETVHEQYLIVKAQTTGSTVEQYGQASIANNAVGTFQGWTDCEDDNRNYRSTNSKAVGPCYASGLRDSVRAEDVSLAVLQHQLADSVVCSATNNRNCTHGYRPPPRQQLLKEIRAIQKTRAAVHKVFARLARKVSRSSLQCLRILYARREISRIQCYLPAMERFNAKCFSVNQNQYAMLKLQTLVNMCEEGVSKRVILRSIDAVCPRNMDRRPFANMAD